MDKFLLLLFLVSTFLLTSKLINAESVIYPEIEKNHTTKPSPEPWLRSEGIDLTALFSKYIKVTAAASKETAATVPHQLDIQYGSTFKTKLDIFGTDLPNDAPILVFVHGGSWQYESIRGTTWFPAHPMYRCGVKTVIVEYDVCPDVTLPQIVEEIYDAARYVFGYAEKMDSRGVYFAGHSSGGHLVAKILSNAALLESTPGSDSLQGAFLISGVYDLRQLVYDYLNDAIQLPIELAVPLSPLFDDYSHLQESGIRIYIVDGENDFPPIETNATDFYEVLQNTWLLDNLYFKTVDRADHFSIGYWLGQDNNYLQNLLVNDLRYYMV